MLNASLHFSLNSKNKNLLAVMWFSISFTSKIEVLFRTSLTFNIINKILWFHNCVAESITIVSPPRVFYREKN